MMFMNFTLPQECEAKMFKDYPDTIHGIII